MDKARFFENEYCFVFDRRTNISYSLFRNALTPENTFELYYTGKERKTKLGKIWNRYFRKYFFGWIRKDFKKKYSGKITIFTNESLSHISLRLLRHIKKESKATVLFFIDELFNDYKTVRRAKILMADQSHYFDLIYTFSPKDAAMHGILLNKSYYSAFNVPKIEGEQGLFFVGSMKNRGSLLDQIYNYLQSVNVSCLFYVYVNSGRDKTNPNFHYTSIPYESSIRLLKSSNVILDLVDERQTGMTLRYYEAVVYNKKLLTNNINIIQQPYYNEHYMKVFRTMDELKNIDPSWFNTTEEIDYHYREEFEPYNFLKQIQVDLKDREG